MPKDLKDFLREDLDKVGKTFGVENFTDMIADETNGTDVTSVQAFMEKVSHPALTMWDITTPSEEAAAVDAARGVAVQAAAAGGGGSTTTVADTAVAVAEPPSISSTPTATTIAASTTGTVPPATKAPAAAPSAGAIPPSDGVGALITLLEQLRKAPPATEIQPGMTPLQQVAVLQASTAMHLLHAGANMLLMQTGIFAAAAVAVPVTGTCPSCLPTEAELEAQISGAVPTPVEIQPKPASRPSKTAAPPEGVERPITSAAIVLPKSVTVAPDKANVAVRTITLGGTGTRTSSVVLGGAEVLPFRHYEGNVGHKPVIAMEVLDSPPKSYPDILRNAYGDLLKDPEGYGPPSGGETGRGNHQRASGHLHPDNGDMSPKPPATS